jgi:hypothetical protein
MSSKYVVNDDGKMKKEGRHEMQNKLGNQHSRSLVESTNLAFRSIPSTPNPNQELD